MLNEGDLSNDASTQEYPNGLLTSIGVEGQGFSATASQACLDAVLLLIFSPSTQYMHLHTLIPLLVVMRLS